MDKDPFYIKKNSGDLEPFSIKKLKESLRNCGVKSNEIASIVQIITPQLYDGISTGEIHKKVYPLLKKSNRVYASKYNLKRAIFDLGPTGYPFERLVAALLKEKGYETRVSTVVQGKCVTHEIDVLAEKEGNTYAIECKFHADSGTASNVKVPLYIHSRFLDVQEEWNSSPANKTILKQGWLVTNTRFTSDAIDYGNCIGLTLLGWNYPVDNGMKANIDAYCLYPITALTTLSKNEKQELIAKDIILVKELAVRSHKLIELDLSPARLKKVLSEMGQLIRSPL